MKTYFPPFQRGTVTGYDAAGAVVMTATPDELAAPNATDAALLSMNIRPLFAGEDLQGWARLMAARALVNVARWAYEPGPPDPRDAPEGDAEEDDEIIY